MSELFVIEAGPQRLEIAPWRGGLVTSYRVEGEEIMYLDQESFRGAGNVRGGIPVLFPWAGPLAEGTFGTGGKLPQHGVARQSAWTREGNELVLRSSAETLALFPWKFELRQRFTLGDEGLLLETWMTNADDRPMPVQLGFHPYFATPDKGALTFELPGTTYRDNDVAERVDAPFDGKLPLLERQIDWELRGLQSRRAAMVGKRRLELSWSERFSVLVVWSLLDKPFVCLEPWTAGRFAQTSGDPDLWTLAPGETGTAWWRIAVA